MQYVTTKCSNTINYNSRSNYYMHNTSIKLVGDRPTDIQTDQQTDRLTLRLIELLSHLKIIQQVSKHIFLKYQKSEDRQTDQQTDRQDLHIKAPRQSLKPINPIRHGVLDLRLGLGGHIVPPLIFRATGRKFLALNTDMPSRAVSLQA